MTLSHLSRRTTQRAKIAMVATLLGLGVPIPAFAQTTIGSIITQIDGWIDRLIPIVIGLGLLFFLWGLAKYILKADDPEAQEEGRSLMVWGVITLFVMVAVWGLVGVISRTFGVGVGGSPPIPQVEDVNNDSGSGWDWVEGE